MGSLYSVTFIPGWQADTTYNCYLIREYPTQLVTPDISSHDIPCNG